MKKLAVLLPLLLTSCATMVKYRNVENFRAREERNIEHFLEHATAAGHFDVIANYVHAEIDRHPDQRMKQLYDGAGVALKHAPNGVYMLALEQYQEDMIEDLDSMVYGLERMRDHGFSYNQDLNYDE